MITLCALLLRLPAALGLALLLSGSAQAEQPAPAAPTVLPAQTHGANPIPALAALLDPALDDPLLRRTPAAIHVVDTRTREEVYARGAQDLLLPASTMKLITTAAALRTLGPAHTFHTDILVDGEIDGAGLLHGDLYVRGGGDPTMVLERLWKLVQEIRLEGVREVEGDVVFDDDLFPALPGIPGWDKTDDLEQGPAYFPPISPLSVNYNAIAIYVGPGEAPGKPARVELESPTPIVQIENQAATGVAHGRHWLKIERRLDGVKTIFTVSGLVPAESDTDRYYRTVGDATAYFTGAFAELCKLHGLKVQGRFLDGSTPQDATLLVRQVSPSLGTILQTMDKQSNNFMAEMVLEALGVQAHGAPGSIEHGLEVVATYLHDLGIPEDSFHLVNGSGLSREARLRPEVLTAVLLDMDQDRLVGPEFRAALSIGGLDGTLRRRFDEDELSGRVRGKTGSLNGVYCLTGYVDASDGTTYAFAILLNDIQGPLSRARKVQDRFVEALLASGEAVDLASVEDTATERGEAGEGAEEEDE